KQLAALVLIFSLVMSVYPTAAYLRTGKALPMADRLQISHNVQNYLFNTQQLLVNSMGLTIFYDKLIFNPLRTKSELKEPIVRLIKENKGSALSEIPLKYFFLFGVLGLLGIIAVIFIIRVILTRTRVETRPFI